MMQAGRLLFPAIRWDADHGFEAARSDLEAGLQLGVGGFIIFGGGAEAVHALTTELRSRSRHSLLIASDLERGAGQQVQGATQLPPLAALGARDDEGITRSAGELTAREARALGINWVYAPVADIDLEPLNPIIGTRAFGITADHVSRHVAAWIHGCHEGGALACAKHFPGHGRTIADSHDALPVVDVDAESLEQDLQPFRAAIKAKVDSVMTAHVSYPALDTDGTAATLSSRILTGLLRERLGFDGLIASDALIMQGMLEGGLDESSAAVRAVTAGCDVLLYPGDLQAVVRALNRDLPAPRVEQAIGRIEQAASRFAEVAPTHWGSAMDRNWAIEVGVETIQVVRGHPHLDPPIEILTIDDDLGGPYPPPARTKLPEALRTLDVEVREIAEPTRGCLVAVYCDVRAWKGRHGLAEQSVARANAAVEHGAALIALFGHPRLAHQVSGRNLISAWGGETVMQEAAARWLQANALR